MKYLLAVIALLFSLSSFAQEGLPADTSSSYVSYGPEPSFPGGLESFYKYVQKEIENLDLSGSSKEPVWVKFLVDEKGEIIKVIILDSPDPGYNNAIKDMFNRMPKWNPARRNGKFIVSEMTLPIFFDE